LPQSAVDQELNVADADIMQQDRLAKFINLLDLAMIPKNETAVDDFVVELFKVTGYVRRDSVARTQADFPLFICGELRHAKADVCIVLRMAFFLSRRTRAWGAHHCTSSACSRGSCSL